MRSSGRCPTDLYNLLVSRIGISATPRVITNLASSTLSLHCSLVSPFTSSGSTFHPRNNSVRNATDSVIPNFLPKHALGPAQHDLSMMRRLHKKITRLSPILKAVNISESAGTPYHLEGLNFPGSSK